MYFCTPEFFLSMKNNIFFIIFASAIFFAACNDGAGNAVKKDSTFNPSTLLDDTTKTENFTTVKWLDSTVDFGVAPYGEKSKSGVSFYEYRQQPPLHYLCKAGVRLHRCRFYKRRSIAGASKVL